MEGKVCTKCGKWKPLEEFNKCKRNKDGRQCKCRECQKEYKKQWHLKNHPKKIKEVRNGKKCTKCGIWKPLEEYNKDKRKKDGRQFKCRECQKEQRKQWYENNPEYNKRYYKDNAERRKEHMREYNKQRSENIKRNNLEYISNIAELIRPIFKELNLPVYGYIYKFENVKTGRVYIGQTTCLLNRRYGCERGIIKSWIRERKEKQSQKFLEELIEEDIELTEILDVACCEYHLNVLEAYWINHHDSYNNGYNNTAGNHITNDGIEEFNKILEENGLEFIDGELTPLKFI